LYWPSLFHDDELFAAWLDWVRHRSEIHKPIKETGAYETLQKLEGWGRDRAIAALRHSIANGYQGLFEPKDGKKPKSEMTPEELDAASERKRRIKIPGRFCKQ